MEGEDVDKSSLINYFCVIGDCRAISSHLSADGHLFFSSLVRLTIIKRPKQLVYLFILTFVNVTYIALTDNATKKKDCQ